MTLVSDLIAARALIDTPKKWARDWHRSGPMCVVRALQELLGGPDAYVIHQPIYRAICDALPPEHTARYGRHSVGRYNDLPRTTHADVMALFDRAIAEASRAIQSTKTGDAA